MEELEARGNVSDLRRRSALVEHRVVVGERFGEPRETRGGNLLERGLVALVADAAHVEDHAVLEVAHLPAALLGPRAARTARTHTTVTYEYNLGVGSDLVRPALTHSNEHIKQQQSDTRRLISNQVIRQQ